MVREQQECGHSRREEKQGAKGNESTGSALTNQATVLEHDKVGGSDGFHWQPVILRQRKVTIQVWGPLWKSSGDKATTATHVHDSSRQNWREPGTELCPA